MRISVSYTITDNESKNKADLRLLSNDLTGNETTKFLVERFRLFHIGVARVALEDEQKKGFEKNPRIVTDNKFDKPDSRVLPFGKIEYYSKLDVLSSLITVFSEIQRLSKVVSGQYRSWNLVFLNGVRVASSLPELQNWVKSAKVKDGDTIRFVNLNAYARRLEYLGVTSQGSSRRMTKNMVKTGRSGKKHQSSTRPMKKALNGVYYLVSKIVSGSKFKTIGQFKPKFEFIVGSEVSGIPIGGQRGSFAPKKNGRGGGRPYLYPSITFKISGRGTNI